MSDICGPLRDLSEYTSVKIVAKDEKCILRCNATSSTEPNQRILKASARHLAVIDRGAPHQLGTLTFIQKNVAISQFISFNFLRLEIHLKNIRCVDAILVDVRDAEVRSKVRSAF